MSVDQPTLDEIDRGILQLFQRDARNNTAVDIGERVGVSDGRSSGRCSTRSPRTSTKLPARWRAEKATV